MSETKKEEITTQSGSFRALKAFYFERDTGEDKTAKGERVDKNDAPESGAKMTRDRPRKLTSHKPA